MGHFLLLYDVVDGFIDRRAPFRQAHLKLAREAYERSELLMAGALTDPVDGAALVFTTEDPSVAERFAKNDPYFTEGLVKEWNVRKWDGTLLTGLTRETVITVLRRSRVAADERSVTMAALYHLLLYDVVDGFTDRRVRFREAHLRLAREAQERGELLMAGRLNDPVDGAAFVFATDDRSVAERFARADPYLKEGLVKKWRVRRWNVVVGGE